MRMLLQDLRYAARGLRKNPAFTLVAVLTLALGVGANTAIFSVLNAVLLRPLSYPRQDPDRVVVITEKRWEGRRLSVSYPNLLDWREQNRVFEQLAAYRPEYFNVTGLDEPLRVLGWYASAGFFSIFGVQAIQGRVFSAEEDRPGGPPVVVLNYPLWQNRFGADPAVIGKGLPLNGRLHTVIGVLPPDFDLIPQEALYAPFEPWIAANPALLERSNHSGIWVLARPKPGVSLAQARTEMEAIVRRLAQQYPNTNSGKGVIVTPVEEVQTSGYRTTLFLLMGAVGLVLLIACTNVANLLLAHAAARQKEIAIRSALGAGKPALIRPFLAESVLLALTGGALGLALGRWSLDLVRVILPANVPRLHQIHVDARVLVYTLAVSLLTGLLFGLAPALEAARVDLMASLRVSASVRPRVSASWPLVVSEVALAFVLSTGAGLLMRSILNLQQLELGFDPRQVLMMQVTLTDPKYSPARRLLFCRQALQQMRSLPGVTSAAWALSPPVLVANWTSVLTVAGRPVPPRSATPHSAFNPISPDYFEALRIPLLKGRAFRDSDDEKAPPVVIVNETLARRFWPHEDPLGQRLKQGWPEDSSWPWREIVGVVRDVKQNGLDTETEMEAYLPLAQQFQPYLTLVLRTSTSPLSLAPAAKAGIHALDPNLPVYGAATFEQLLARWLAPRRFTLVLFGIFAALALLLAAVGIYGVMAYSVSQRTPEIGIRMALGARQGDVLRMVLRQALSLAGIGLLVGLVIALALTRLMGSLLYGIGSTDPATLAGVSLVLALVALLASYLPARRATKVDPVIALRAE